MGRVARSPFATPLSPYALFRRLRGPGRNAVLLESRPGPARLARYSIVASDPVEFLQDSAAGDPLAVSREILSQHALDAPEGGGFSGGLIGTVAYDAVTHLDLPSHSAQAPTYLMGLYLDAVVYEHATGAIHYVSAGEDRSEAWDEAARRPAPPEEAPAVADSIESTVDEATFHDWVRTTKARIRDGETYQTVLTRRFDVRHSGGLGPLYRHLQDENPSPYMYFLDFDAAKVVGSSPEMLVRVENRVVETFPIAGTRPVAANRSQDAVLRKELLGDEKENAEHIMLVDLARNDLARVGQVGSVEVPSFRQLESYANVHHLVSRVTARLAPERTALDAFAAVFPAGTVTGAPKIRAMQIIDELEQAPRGLYAGAILYAGLDGNLDSAITIRTAVSTKPGRLSVQAGAGIVADSTPEHEWSETRHKAQSILGPMGALAEK